MDGSSGMPEHPERRVAASVKYLVRTWLWPMQECHPCLSIRVAEDGAAKQIVGYILQLILFVFISQQSHRPSSWIYLHCRPDGAMVARQIPGITCTKPEGWVFKSLSGQKLFLFDLTSFVLFAFREG
jgi:hypothetical protein